MRIAVLGTGPIGQTVAGTLSELVHQVAVGTRDPQATPARTEPDTFGNPPFQVWHQAHLGVGLVGLAEGAADAELVVNATNGVGSTSRSSAEVAVRERRS